MKKAIITIITTVSIALGGVAIYTWWEIGGSWPWTQYEYVEASEEINRREETSFLVINMIEGELQTIPLSDSEVYFDYYSTGFQIWTEWVVTTKRYILARDIDGNGTIDNGNELFGATTVMEDGEFANNGFLALRELCDTKDGIFDKRSAAYDEVYIWVGFNDIGDDGISLISNVRIISIDTNYTVVDYVDGEENKVRHVSTAKLDNGEVVEVEEVRLSYTPRETKAVYEVEVSDDVKDLPQIRGHGTTYSLHQAMMIDESGELQRLVKQFTSEKRESVRRELTRNIMYKWTNTNTRLGLTNGLTGHVYDDRTELDFDMERIDNAIDSMVNTYYECLMTQSHYRYLYRQMDMDNSESEGIDFTLVTDELLENIETDRALGDELLKNYIYNMFSLGYGEDADKTTFQDRIEEADVRGAIYIKMLELESSVLKDIYEHRGLSGTEEDDIFLINASDNTIEDIKGDDTYIFGPHSGDNTIIDMDGDNTIVLSIMPEEFKATLVQSNIFGPHLGYNTVIDMDGDNTIVRSIMPEEFKVTLVQSDMKLKVGDNVITIKNFELADSYSVVFLDGSMTEI